MVCHILFICSSVNGHLGCFCFLAIVYNDSVNICVQVFVWTYFSFLLGICLGVEFLGHVITLALTF